MQKNILTFAVLLFFSPLLFSQITNNFSQATSINVDGATPEASAILDIQSTDRGMLTPRMTTAQRLGISAPSTGLLVFDMDTGSFWFFGNGIWNEIPTIAPLPENGDNNATIPIPDGNLAGISSVITLSGADTVAADMEFQVCIDITHPWVSDLDISLEAPDGTSVVLSSDNGGTGDNYTGTCFTTEASVSIQSAPAPFTGNWQPEGSFADFEGEPVAGNWELTVVDDTGGFGNFGQLNFWSLSIARAASAVKFLSDTDGDTRVTVENLPDEDLIRFRAKGVRMLQITPDSSHFFGIVRTEGKFVSGAPSNNVSGFNSFVAGGSSNTASGSRSFVGGGSGTLAFGSNSFVGGGSEFEWTDGIGSGVNGHIAAGQNTFIGGGAGNETSGDQSAISGGARNETSGNNSFIGGGRGLRSKSLCETVFGIYNTSYFPNSTTQFDPEDRLFVIGNGTSFGNTSDAMVVLKNGHIGFGTSTPDIKLHVANGTDASPTSGGFIQTGNSNGLNLVMDENEIMARNDSATSILLINISGGDVKMGNGDSKVGVGRTPSTNDLEVDGTASKSSAGNWLANSDARLKKNIRPLDSEAILRKMLSLQGVTYEWDDDQTGSTRPEGTMYGFTAQNIQSVFPELVDEDNLGFLQTAYGTYDAMTVEAMRVLYQEIENGKLRMEHLEAENVELKSQLSEMDELKSRLARLEVALLQTAEAMGED